MKKEFLSIILLCPLITCAMVGGQKYRDPRRYIKKYNYNLLRLWIQNHVISKEDPKVIDIDGLKRSKMVNIK